MKLLFVIPSITNYFTFLEDLTDVLRARGHEVHLATSRKHIARITAYRREIHCTVHDIDFPRAITPYRHYAAAKHVRKLVKEIAPDLINIHFSAALFTAMLAKDKTWPPTTGTIHGLGSPLISGWRKAIIAKAEKWSAEKVDEVYVLTSDDRDYLKRNAPAADVRKLNSFGMGCDLQRFDRNKVSAETKLQIRKENNLTPDNFVYIFIGRQTNFKGFDKVVRAFLRVKETHPQSRLLLVGEKDRIHPTSLKPKYEKALKNDPTIIRVGWRENVQDYLAVAHLNVFPSEREGLPVNLMESLAMGVPVITVDSRGCREVVRHEIDGIVLNDTGIDSLIDAMRQLQDDKSTLDKYAKGAVEGRDRFDRSLFVQDQLEIFTRLTGQPV